MHGAEPASSSSLHAGTPGRYNRLDFEGVGIDVKRTAGGVVIGLATLAVFHAPCAADRRADLEVHPGVKAQGVATPTIPAGTFDDVVKFAYFTNAPPRPGVFLLDGSASLPPRVNDFRPHETVTFFYAVNRVDRLVRVETRWAGPAGATVKQFEDTLNQAGSSGSWSWRMQTLGPSELREPGVWTVEVIIDGLLAGRCAFTVRR